MTTPFRIRLRPLFLLLPLLLACEATQTLAVTLVSTLSKLSLTTSMSDAEIWVNNELKGTGRWEGSLPAGAYIVETRKAGPRTRLWSSACREHAPGGRGMAGREATRYHPRHLQRRSRWHPHTPLLKKGYATKSVEVTIEEGGIAAASATMANAAEKMKNDVGDHEYVDLGLPSGLLWATCNVGASSPEDYGDYFAWGETAAKRRYYTSSYKWCNGSFRTLTKYNTKSSNGEVDNKTMLDLSDDAANVNWEGSWRMATKEEWTELKNTRNCTWTWTSQGGHNGYKVTSKRNGNSLFLPASGCYWSSELCDADDIGYYWSSSLNEGYPLNAWRELFYSDDLTDWFGSARYLGFSIRPVCRP